MRGYGTLAGPPVPGSSGGLRPISPQATAPPARRRSGASARCRSALQTATGTTPFAPAPGPRRSGRVACATGDCGRRPNARRTVVSAPVTPRAPRPRRGAEPVRGKRWQARADRRTAPKSPPLVAPSGRRPPAGMTPPWHPRPRCRAAVCGVEGTSGFRCVWVPERRGMGRGAGQGRRSPGTAGGAQRPSGADGPARCGRVGFRRAGGQLRCGGGGASGHPGC